MKHSIFSPKGLRDFKLTGKSHFVLLQCIKTHCLDCPWQSLLINKDYEDWQSEPCHILAPFTLIGLAFNTWAQKFMFHEKKRPRHIMLLLFSTSFPVFYPHFHWSWFQDYHLYFVWNIAFFLVLKYLIWSFWMTESS